MNLYQDVFFRALDAVRGRRTIERLRFLRRSQHWSREELRAWQLERLNALLVQARDHSAYYRDLLAAVRLPLASVDELSSIPPLTKDTIRREKDRIRCGNLEPGRYIAARTGGSTGEPTQYFWDKRGRDWNRGCVYRAAEWGGAPLGTKAMQMSGSHFDYTQAQQLSNRIVYFLNRYRDCSVAFLTDELLERYYETLVRWRPAAIWGYASGVRTLAAHVNKHHPGESFDHLKALFTSSETLRPEQRQSIEAAFGAGKVFNQYGSREMYIGSECREHAGYHLHGEVVMLEIVDRDNRPCRPGEIGRVLVTDLSNHAFPFIRYEIGDVGVMAPDEPCPCGITLPRLARVEGRIADLIVLRDRVLTPPNLTLIFSDKPGIKAYQVRQDSLDRLDVLVVPDGAAYTEELERYVKDSMRKLVGDSVELAFRTVPEIAVPESGKRRYVVSTVSKDWV